MTRPPQRVFAGVDITSMAIREVGKVSSSAPRSGQELGAAGEAFIWIVRQSGDPDIAGVWRRMADGVD
jgi:hypothetical protein